MSGGYISELSTKAAEKEADKQPKKFGVVGQITKKFRPNKVRRLRRAQKYAAKISATHGVIQRKHFSGFFFQTPQKIYLKKIGKNLRKNNLQ